MRYTQERRISVSFFKEEIEIFFIDFHHGLTIRLRTELQNIP